MLEWMITKYLCNITSFIPHSDSLHCQRSALVHYVMPASASAWMCLVNIRWSEVMYLCVALWPARWSVAALQCRRERLFVGALLTVSGQQHVHWQHACPITSEVYLSSRSARRQMRRVYEYILCWFHWDLDLFYCKSWVPVKAGE